MAGTDLGDAWLRVRVDDAGRAGLADDVRVLARAIAWSRCGCSAVDRATTDRGRRGAGRRPHELFAAFLTEQRIDDPRLAALFAELLDEELCDVRPVRVTMMGFGIFAER